jgi:hypothetical protein
MVAPNFNIATPADHTHVLFAAENALQTNSPTVGIATDQIVSVKSGLVSSETNVVSTPTITGGAYATPGLEVGGLMTFANAMASSLSGRLQSICIKCKTVQTTNLKLYVFDTNPTNSTWANNATPAINAADIPYLMGVYTLSQPDSGLGTETLWCLDNINKLFVAASTSLYAVLVAVATPTFVSTSDIAVKLSVITD